MTETDDIKMVVTHDRQGTPAYNRRLAQCWVKWLIKHSTSHQLLWCIDSLVLRNPPLRQTVVFHAKKASHRF